MFAIFCTRRLRFLTNGCICFAKQNAVLIQSCSSGVCKNVSEKFFPVSYLINSCGLSSKDAISASKKLCFKSPKKPDQVLELLREYGFTDAHIPRIVTRWPYVLFSLPKQNPIAEARFFCSIGVSRPVLAHKLSLYPSVLTCSLENFIIPVYNDLKKLLQSDERVVCVFSRAPWIFGYGGSKGINSNISMLRERGVPESSIVYLVMYQPSVLLNSKEKLAADVDRAFTMGFDVSRHGFIEAVRVFVNLSKATLKQKMEVYRRCGWSEYDIGVTFLRHPLIMNMSEKKIMANMEFLVNEFGCKPADVAQYPVLLTYNLDRRIKPRCLVTRVLNDKGLKKMTGVAKLLSMSEENFLKNYIVKYQKDIPELLEIYRGK